MKKGLLINLVVFFLVVGVGGDRVMAQGCYGRYHCTRQVSVGNCDDSFTESTEGCSGSSESSCSDDACSGCSPNPCCVGDCTWWSGVGPTPDVGGGGGPPTPTPTCYPVRTRITVQDTINDITVNWTDLSSNERLFSVYRKQGAGAYQLVATVVPIYKQGVGDKYTFVDTNISCGSSYTYRVASQGLGSKAEGACLVTNACKYCPLGTPYPVQCASCLAATPVLSQECQDAGVTSCNIFSTNCPGCVTNTYGNYNSGYCLNCPRGTPTLSYNNCVSCFEGFHLPLCPVTCAEFLSVCNTCRTSSVCNEGSCTLVPSETPACHSCYSQPRSASCQEFTPWFSSGGGGDITAPRGTVQSNVPAVNTYLGSAKLVMDGFIPTPTDSGFATSDPFPQMPYNLPGVMYAEDTNGLASNEISARNTKVVYGTDAWTEVSSRKENSYAELARNIETRKAMMPIASYVTAGTINEAGLENAIAAAISGGNTVDLRRPDTGMWGVNAHLLPVQTAVLRYAGDLTINSGTADPINLDQRAMILAVDGNVRLDSQLTFFDPQGFIFILASGNITVGSTVGEISEDVNITEFFYPAHLKGIFYAGNRFIVERLIPTPIPPAMDRSLRIDGTVIGMQGVDFSRNYKGAYPSVYVQYRPEWTYALTGLGLRRKITQELLPP